MTRAALVAFVFLIVGVVLLFVVARWPSNDAYNWVFEQLSRNGTSVSQSKDKLDAVAEGSRFSIIISAIGGTLVSIGLVALAWEILLNRAWLQTIKSELAEALADPEAIRNIAKRKQGVVLKQILLDYHGKELGEALFGQIESLKQDSRGIRKDFSYQVLIYPGSKEHHRARFKISFVVPRLPAKPRLAFAQVVDSLDLYTKYDALIESSPDSIYRYILQSSTRVNPEVDFVIDNVRIETVVGNKMCIDLHSTVVSDEITDSVTFQLKPSTTDQLAFRALRKGECRVTLDISTVVDAQRSEFPIWLGYPVRDFRSQIVVQAIGAQHVDVLQFFSSSARYRREDVRVQHQNQANSPANSAVASGVLEGLVLPNSGLTYIWR